MKIFRLSTKLLLFVASMAIFFACASAPHCPDQPIAGNLGSLINSEFDEFAPVLYGNSQLLFTSNRKGGKSNEYRDSISKYGDDIYSSEIINRQFAYPDLVKSPPINTYSNDGAVAFYYNDKTGVLQMYFSTFTGADDKGNSDIYLCENVAGQWSEPEIVPSLNSPSWDAQPTISSDGNTIIFVSDREGGIGGTDLWLSRRIDRKTWGVPVNLGENINSRYDEITPLLGADNTLYFASKAFSPDRKFDIISAEPKKISGWNKPMSLGYPINTQYDEISPMLWGDSIIFASNRPGGCGGYDLYAMRLCNSVLVRGAVSGSEIMIHSSSVIINDEAGKRIDSVPLTSQNTFEVNLPSKKTFSFRFQSACYKGQPIEKKLTTPCSSEPVVMKLRLFVPEQDTGVSKILNEYSVPFFVTGYFLPNTSNNLANLRLKFAYNLLGNSDSTRYIEYPKDEYDAYAKEVDRALAEAAEVINQKISELAGDCSTGKDRIEITVEGFADSRNFSDKAKYFGEQVWDDEMKVFVPQNAQMTNQLVSLLRAYYTALAIRASLAQTESYKLLKDRVSFVVRGKGVNEIDAGDLVKQRKINITLRKY